MQIDRRTMISGAAATGLLAATGTQSAFARVRRPPNILFLLADDLRFDGVGYRNPMVRTPNIDRLAARGTRFSNAFITTSICCTSRASIQTGTYARRHQVWDFNTPLEGPLTTQTYPYLLRRHGYRTGYFGKYGIADKSAQTDAQMKQDFDDWRSFDDYYAPDDVARQWHNNRRISDLGQNFLRSARKDQPFCLTLGFKAPHAKDDGDPVMGPYVSEPDMLQLYEHDIFRRNAIMNEEAFATVPEFIQKSEARQRWQQRFSNDALWQDSVHKYFGLVSGMDRAIGEVLAALERVGLADDTMIVDCH